MEFLSSSISSKPYFPSPFSSTTSLTRKIPYKFHKPHLKPYTNPPFLTILPLKISKTPYIFAQFGGPTKRRNSLRKKLNGNGGPQVRQNPQKIIDPVHQFVDNNQNFDLIVSRNDNNLENGKLELGEKGFNFENNGEFGEKGKFELGEKRFNFENNGEFGKKGKFELGEKRLNLENDGKFGENLQWGKLEGWVEQYKKDIEFWGIGSNPIFTVFQDCSGNVEKVLVDEDEIIRRNGFDPFRFRKERVLDEIGVVNEKVSYAKNLAKEVESGKNVIPRNSCVAKFVGSSERLGVVGMVRSVFVKGKSIGEVSRVGFSVVCGFMLAWVVKKVWGMRVKEVELTGFEKEMMRRKMKSRMVKEKSQMGSVEVVEEPLERGIVVTERPRIDKEEVMNMIRGVKGSNDSLVVLDVGGARKSESTNMDSKIKEIQMMARHAREIEKGVDFPSESDELDVEVPKKIYLEEKTTNEKPEDDLSLVDELEKEAVTVPPFVGNDDAEELAGNMNLLDMSKTVTLGNSEMQSGDAEFTNAKVSEWNGNAESLSTSNGRNIDDAKSHINGAIQSHGLSNSSNLNEEIQSHVSSRQLNLPKKTPTRKPKIIRSVKEAREYLSKKLEVGDAPTSAAISRLGENDRAPESSDVEKTAPSEEVSQLYNVQQNKLLSNDTSEWGLETENEIKHNIPHGHPPFAVNLSVNTAINSGEIAKNNEMYKLSDAHEKSGFITGENDLCDGYEEVNQPHLTKRSVENVDKLDEKLKPTVLSEVSDLDSGRSAFLAASNSNEELGFTSEPASRHTNVPDDLSLSDDNDKVNVNGINGMAKPSELSEICVPVAVGRNSHGSGSKDKAFLPFEIKDEDDYWESESEVEERFWTAETSEGHGNDVDHRDRGLIADKESWLEKNFHEVEPIVKKIGSGFRNSYNVAREKIKEDVDTNWDLMKLSSISDDSELEWMQDDKLREIVFKVRDNELAGRDPFHSMDPEDKVAFFEGLERKVEKENQRLSTLHEWLHSNIENIDYGADGISLYDPPEKVIPRWKGPPLDTISEFLNSSKNQQVESSLQKANEPTKHDSVESSLTVSTSKPSLNGKNTKVSRTVIEASDGSIKPGKKSGKEFWQHTKKWSRGFVESYNAETDPEVKAVMKDMGKDLDRWITEKEIQEAAELMDKYPQQKKVVEKKLNKLKREMELFGPQAVVSKYREYAEEKEVDYLWWLDLPHVLCIEMYTYEGEDQRVGFYSLEMAEDLDLEPKPRHVIAFQDPGDCKNFCYIIQAHLEMLGKGKAFIVPQPPKDVFWQAKENGFGVTVIRKGELKLNVDQPLEEVEELISEIGSKMYHDKLMRERSVDISSLMKGVFGVSPPSSRRKRKNRARKRPGKS